MSDFKNTEDAIRQGKYLNAFLYFLIAALISVATYFIVENRNLKKENRNLLSNAQSREDKKDAQCDSTIERMTLRFRNDISTLQQEYRDFRIETIEDMRQGREKSEVLASQSRNAARKFKVESRKTKQFSDQIDSVTDNLVK